MKVAHESPKKVFKEVQAITDIDYALVHLFEADKDYYDLFEDALSKGREVILDNSLFELGSSFEPSEYVEWVKKLKPTYYIIPDVLENAEDNVNLARDFLSRYPELKDMNIKSMGVVHGENYEKYKWCYQEMCKLCDKVCITLDSDWWHKDLVEGKNVYDTLAELSSEDKNRRWCQESASGRASTIKRLMEDGVWDYEKDHHLLGIYLPVELNNYKDIESIKSIDTSNPVVFGVMKEKYPENGFDTKPSKKMEKMMNDDIDKDQLDCIIYNIKKFKDFSNNIW